jgi:hypothetical protein
MATLYIQAPTTAGGWRTVERVTADSRTEGRRGHNIVRLAKWRANALVRWRQWGCLRVVQFKPNKVIYEVRYAHG